MLRVDVAIIGGGIGGAGLAAMIGGRARTVILEMEAQPGYHTTGRSAAFYAETYGGPAVQPLTTASRAFLEQPPSGFADVPLIGPRGGLHLAEVAHVGLLAEMDAEFAASGVTLEPLDRAGIERFLPAAGPQWVEARYEPGCRDMDVAAIHQGFLRMAKQAGTNVLCDAELLRAERVSSRWVLETRAGPVSADIVVIAAGAWADQVALLLGVRPLGIQPLRRTVVQADVEPVLTADTPLVIDAAGRFYFRPEGGGAWISPHDETPDVACDAQPQEMDIAVAIDRFERAGSWRVRRVTRSWAGLRSFAPDRAPVYGFDPSGQGVFWCAGQGGFGIQTSPAASMLAAALLTGTGLPDAVSAIDAGRYDPGRFSLAVESAG